MRRRLRGVPKTGPREGVAMHPVRGRPGPLGERLLRAVRAGRVPQRAGLREVPGELRRLFRQLRAVYASRCRKFAFTFSNSGNMSNDVRRIVYRSSTHVKTWTVNEPCASAFCFFLFRSKI